MKRTWNEANRFQPTASQGQATMSETQKNHSFSALNSMNAWLPQSHTGDLSSHTASSSGAAPPALPPMSSDASRNSPQSAYPHRTSSPDPPNPQHMQALSASGKAGKRLPAITRKVKACTACRKQKMKCDMEGDQPPCTRCVRRGLPCVLNKSLQSLFDASAQTHAMQNDILNMFSTLVEVCNHNNLKPPKPLQVRLLSGAKNGTEPQQDTRYEEEDGSRAASRPMSPSDMEAPINAFLEVSEKAEPSSQVAAASPYGSTTSKKGPIEPDLISSGIISSDMGEILVRRYLSRLDHYLYSIGSAYTDLKSLRSSPILLAAVCTVSALHDEAEPKVYEACNHEFQRLVSKSLFENRGVEYLRALCIGSYWLSGASRILNSDALRRAADVRLPKYFYQVTMVDATGQQHAGDLSQTAKLDRVRLWYLLYICDQHLSILYNRDPIIHGSQDLVLGWETFLDSDQTCDSDVRIASQVALLQIMSQIRTTFGSESAEPVPKALTKSFNNYNRQIDQWYSRFSPIFKPNPQIGDFPHKGLTLHYHFAKLYLGHHVFRGLNYGQIPTYFLQAAHMAYNASNSIFELVLEDLVLKDSLIGVPFYFHVMMSFAGQFMLSCSPYSGQLCLEVKDNLALMSKAIAMFKSIACISSHPLRKMTAALERRLDECKAILDGLIHANGAMGGDTRSELFQSSNDQLWGAIQHNNLRSDRDEQGKAKEGYRMGFPDAMSVMVRPGDSSAYIGGPAHGPGSFGMAPLTHASNMSSDAVFQDFAGFDFPSLHMSFTSGP